MALHLAAHLVTPGTLIRYSTQLRPQPRELVVLDVERFVAGTYAGCAVDAVELRLGDPVTLERETVLTVLADDLLELVEDDEYLAERAADPAGEWL